MTIVDEARRQLAIANRILANEDVVDAFGHVSLRHPENPERFLLARSVSPALVTPDDIMEFDLDCNAIDDDRRPYGERPIHGAAFQARPDVHAVVHNHSHAVIPFGVTDTPIKPLVHVGSGIGQDVPVWDIRDNFGHTNMLVLTMEQGHDLAKCIGDGRVALMRGHGCVVVGPSLKEAVMVSIYLQVNAELLLASMPLGEVKFLSPEEEQLYQEIHFSPLAMDRAWEYFEERADLSGI